MKAWVVRDEGNGTFTVVLPDDNLITGFESTREAHGWILSYLEIEKRSEGKAQARRDKLEEDRKMLGATLLEVKGKQ